MFLVQFKLSLHIDLGLDNSNKLALQIFIRKLLFMNKYLIMVDSEKILVLRADYINIFYMLYYHALFATQPRSILHTSVGSKMHLYFRS